MKKLYLLLPFFMAVLVSCSDDDDVSTENGGGNETPANVTSGSADFSNYVAVGNSLTAGFSDNALFISGQTASLPNMLATQFALAGGGEFNIPLMADDLGGLILDMNQISSNRLILSFAGESPAPAPVEGVGTTNIRTSIASDGPFNNMGVPGAKSFHLVAPGYGNVDAVALGLANPYFARFASAPDATILGDAAAQAPSFFTLWIGNNDVLSYVTTGGSGVDQTGNTDPSTYAGNDISDPGVVASIISNAVQALSASGANGAIANIPDVTTIPFLTTVPYNPLNPETNDSFAAQVPALQMTFGGINQVFAALGVPERQIVFSDSAPSPVVIRDESLTDLSAQLTGGLIQGGADESTAAVLGFLYGQARQATENDLLVLTSQNVIGNLNETAFATLQALGVPAAQAGSLAVNGITFPLEDQWVMTPEEIMTANTAVTAYNTAIEQIAMANGLALVDANALLVDIAANGLTLSDGSVITDTFATGGGFSLDGVHPSPRGYAILANEFIKEINTTFGATLPEVDPLQFTGLYVN